MAKKRKSTRTRKVSRVNSVGDPGPGWDFLKEMRCVQSTAFDNGSRFIIGTLPSKTK
jgi:hypothetical protein